MVERIGKIIFQILNKKEKSVNTEIKRFTEQILNADNKKHFSVKQIKKGIIFCVTDSSVWQYDFYLRKTEALKTIKNRYPQIKDIKVKIGELDD